MDKNTLWKKCAAFHGHECGGLTIGYKAALYALELLDISLENVSIVGEITKNSFDEYEVSAHLQGKMVLQCSVTLKPVNVPFDVEMEQNVSDFIEETGEKSIICENTLDIFPIIWENILMEIPMKVVSDDISDRTLSGNGWKVISGNEEPEKNPELEKLKDLL